MPHHVLRSVEPGRLLVSADHAVERADQMLEEIFMALAARAKYVGAPEEHISRPVDRIVGVEAGGFQLA